MSRLNELLEQISVWAAHPEQAVREAAARSGRAAVGCFLELCPEELVTAAGLLPVGLWGGGVELSAVKRYFPSFFCAPIQQTLELGMRGVYNGVLCAVLVPILCDSLKSAGQNWRLAVPQIPMLSFVYPQNRALSCGMQFLESEYAAVLARLEEISGKRATPESFEAAFATHNRCRAALREFLSLAPLHLDIVTPRVRHAVMKAALYCEKGAYAALVEELNALLAARPAHAWSGRRVVVTGILLDAPELLRALEEKGIAVVGDALMQESGQVMADVPADGGTPLARLALRWRAQSACPLALDTAKERAARVLELARSADGIVFCLTSFCDPEEYDYPVLRKVCEREGVPHILVEVNGSASVQQAVTQIEAFAELLEA